MSLFVRCLQPGARWLCREIKRNRVLFEFTPFNLKNCRSFSTEKYTNVCIRSELSLSNETVKKYIEWIIEEYERNDMINAEISSEQGLIEISKLLKSRSTIGQNMKSLEELVKQDEEMKKLGEEEYLSYEADLKKLDQELLELILQNSGREECRDIILEITTGVGGQEAMLFARDLLIMYLGYLEYLGFGHDIIHEDATTGIGGIRHVTIAISGHRALEIFRHEGGVHRVQRIPATEKSGRVHTSTVSVAVLPQPTDIDINLKEKDLKIETKKSSGAGGQHVNTTDSAVRITHLPTGISVESQTDRSQIKNRQTAMIRLRAKIYEKQLNEQRTTSGELRKKQMGLGLRNEKIRTYNFNQDRITDHRITDGTMHNLKGFLEGGEDLQDLQIKLQRHMQIKILQEAIEKVVK